MESELERWTDAQHRLARALGLTPGEWAAELEKACDSPGLVAAILGALVARGLGASALDELDRDELRAQVRPAVGLRRMEHPVVQAAVDASAPTDRGGRLLRRRPRTRTETETPVRGRGRTAPSARTATPDAPGEEDV